MQKKILFCFIGRTSSGKSVIAREVANKLGLRILQSYTTRAPRREEMFNPDVDHLFISEEEMEDFKDDIVAYTKIGSTHYFCTKEQLMNSDIYVIDPNGLEFLYEQNIQGLELIPIYIDAPYEIRKERFMNRGALESAFLEREAKEKEQFDRYEEQKGWRINVKNTFILPMIVSVTADFMRECLGEQDNGYTGND